MPIRRASLALLLQVKTEKLPFAISIPVPLCIVEDVFTSLSLLWGGFAFLFPNKHKKIQKSLNGSIAMDVREIVSKLADFLQEMRSYGPLTLVEVHDGKNTKIHIKLF